MTALVRRDELPDFGEIVRSVATTSVQPVDVLHVAAILEMNGWTDDGAVALGFDDVFALAEAVFSALRTQVQRKPTGGETERRWWKILLRGLREYMSGLVFAAPVVMSSYSVLTLKYSLWSYLGFSTEIATGIAIGTFGSFLVAGGFTQAMARRGMFYLSQNQYSLARRSSIQMLLLGLAVTLLLSVLSILLMLVVPVLPWSMFRVAWLYFVELTVIWLGIGLLYIVRQQLVVLLLLAAGIGMVYAEYQIYHVDMMVAQAVGMGVVGGLSVVAAIVFLVALERRNDTGGRIVMPRWSQVSNTLAPFFIYGVLYFGLLFSDRLLAWSKPAEFHPFVIWFMGDYELGLDWALWTLMLPMGLVELYVNSLFRRMSQRQQTTAIDHIPALNRRFHREHTLYSVVLFVAGLISLGLITLVMRYLYAIGTLPVDPFSVFVTRVVFFIAAPTYCLLTVGLQNALVLFSMNTPWPVLRAAAWGVVADLVIGFLASRYFDYEYAVVGVVVGAIIFVVISGRAAYQVLTRLDYHMVHGV